MQVENALVQKSQHGLQMLAVFGVGGTVAWTLGCLRRRHEMMEEGQFVEGLRPFSSCAACE